MEGETVRVTASVGISLYPDDGLDLESLLKHADIALYEAKNAGRDNYRFFDADMDIGHGERLALQQALRHAIGTEQIFLEYQPVLDLHTGQMVSFEAMVRWRHPELGVLAPGRFVPLAEQCGLILPLGEQVIELVFRQITEWRAAQLTVRPVAVNLSPQQLANEELVPLVVRLATRHGVELSLLQLEVTETAVMQDAGRHVAALEALRELGCKVFIDDFGTGYSSVSQLKSLPIDRIKIDGSFVRDMPVDANDAAIVGAVISMARSLDIELSAEGIESAEQLGMLQDLGCRLGQGFHFSRPIAPSQCVALLEQAARNTRLSDSLKIRQLRASAGQAG
jgi:predicted signal transduction protein with EAL and GGDEF domain